MRTFSQADAIAKGWCEVLSANVAALPFKDNAYDMATAFEDDRRHAHLHAR
jgi:hypothetical protein